MSIEPGLYFPGVGGYRHSDTVLVTDGGAEPLTCHPTDIDKLTVASWKPMRRFFVQPFYSGRWGCDRSGLVALKRHRHCRAIGKSR